MFSAFKQELRVNRRWYVTPSFIVGMFIVGIIIMAVVTATVTDSMTYFPVGTLMACIAGVAASLFFEGTSFAQRFQLAVTMGRSRGSVIGAEALACLLRQIATVVLIAALGGAELLIYRTFFGWLPPEYDFSSFPFVWVAVIYLVAAEVVSLLMSGVNVRWGRKGYFVFYLLFVLSCSFGPKLIIRILDNDEGKFDALVRVLSAVPAAGWAAIGAVVAAALSAFSVHLLMKSDVNLE